MQEVDWEGKDQGKIGRITFDEEEYAIFLIEGQEIGGKECDMNGEKRTLTYVVNLDTEPIEIDFIIKKIASGEEMRLVGIGAFKDSNTMNIAIHDKERPTNFESDDAIVLCFKKGY